jgi:threonine dehydratase
MNPKQRQQFMNSSPGSSALPTIRDVETAARRIAGQAVETPLLEWPGLNERAGGRVFVKPELLQRTGSFKFRGAFNKIKHVVDDGGGKGGVVAYSSGNHAQGVAAAAQILGLPSAIVMPSDAPAIKLANTRSYGAEIILYDRNRENREAIANELAARRKATIVPPFDDLDIIAGQGTTGLEMASQAKARGVDLDAALLPCGGGGLISGSATALKATWPNLEIRSCEPAAFDDTRRSLATHHRLPVEPGGTSICDGLLSPIPGEMTFAINDRLLAGGIAVSDEEVLSAMAFAFRVMKLVVEPSGAVGLAAILTGKFDCRGRNVGLVCSGGNVDPEVFARCLARPD